MKFPRLRLWTAAVLFVLAVGLLLASLAPLPRKRQVIPMPPAGLLSPLDLSFHVEGR